MNSETTVENKMCREYTTFEKSHNFPHFPMAEAAYNTNGIRIGIKCGRRPHVH